MRDHANTHRKKVHVCRMLGEDRERGFQLHFAGANEDRLKEARPKRQSENTTDINRQKSNNRRLSNRGRAHDGVVPCVRYLANCSLDERDLW